MKEAQRTWAHKPFLLLTLFREDWHSVPRVKAHVFHLVLGEAFKSCNEKLRSLSTVVWWSLSILCSSKGHEHVTKAPQASPGIQNVQQMDLDL